jgi:hypothetical protein
MWGEACNEHKYGRSKVGMIQVFAESKRGCCCTTSWLWPFSAFISRVLYKPVGLFIAGTYHKKEEINMV